ncbi:unnamed protein product [Owenia fusiformis]|uniref:Uncharacterized protein n=1 Tax=Owenia fusiformis TaxID=6347 RepID=A0A8S4NWN4_OWEFU|nr:unnamed protein product [Owenia fusiformis]
MTIVSWSTVLFVFITGISSEYCQPSSGSLRGFDCPCDGDMFNFYCDYSKKYCCELQLTSNNRYKCCTFEQKYGAVLGVGIGAGVLIIITSTICCCVCKQKAQNSSTIASTPRATTPPAGSYPTGATLPPQSGPAGSYPTGATLPPQSGPAGSYPTGATLPPQSGPAGSYPKGATLPPQSGPGSYPEQGVLEMAPYPCYPPQAGMSGMAPYPQPSGPGMIPYQQPGGPGMTPYPQPGGPGMTPYSQAGMSGVSSQQQGMSSIAPYHSTQYPSHIYSAHGGQTQFQQQHPQGNTTTSPAAYDAHLPPPPSYEQYGLRRCTALQDDLVDWSVCLEDPPRIVF